MTYRKIFSVVNEQTASTVMARYAIALALASKAELVLYAAPDEGSQVSILHHVDRHLDHLDTIAFEQKVHVTRITEVGNIRTLLPQRLTAEKADLVLYPLTPDERYGSNLQEHTVQHLLRTIRADLAIMRIISMAKPHPRHILVPLRERISDKERRLLFIGELARSFQSEVTLFHHSAEAGSKGLPDDISRFRQELRQQQVTVRERSGSGELSKAIAVEAITRHHDLIVLGASERSLLRSLFFGNPSSEVMQHPPCNAILFRAGQGS